LGLSFFYAFRSFLVRSLTNCQKTYKRENQILDKIKADSVKYLKGDSHVDYGINGTTHAKSLFIVDFPLFDYKNDVNFSDNQIFDEKKFKCFETLNGIKIYFTFIPCLIAEKD